jgi:hypothetical protein
MKKFLALALVSSFALAGFAAEEKKAEPKKGCGMACCEKAKASCKDCPECGKKKDAHKDAKKG